MRLRGQPTQEPYSTSRGDIEFLPYLLMIRFNAFFLTFINYTLVECAEQLWRDSKRELKQRTTATLIEILRQDHKACDAARERYSTEPIYNAISRVLPSE